MMALYLTERTFSKKHRTSSGLKNNREALRSFGVGDILYSLWPLEGNGVEKFDGVDVVILRKGEAFRT